MLVSIPPSDTPPHRARRSASACTTSAVAERRALSTNKRAAAIERLESGDSGARKPPARVDQDGLQVGARSERVIQRRQSARIEPAQVERCQSLARVERVVHLADTAQVAHPLDRGDLVHAVEPVVGVNLREVGHVLVCGRAGD